MVQWFDLLSHKEKAAEGVKQYLIECRDKEQKPFQIPPIFPDSLEKMKKYYKENPEADEKKDREALKRIQPHTEFAWIFIPSLRSYFTRQIELENTIKEIEQKLPRKKEHSSIAAYSQPKEFIIRDPGFDIKKFKFQGDYACILMYYNPLALENPPEVKEKNISDFGFAFELFYDVNITTENHSITEEIKEPGYELITIPKKNPEMMVYFNTERKNMWFAYKKADKEAKRIISGFMKKLREN